MDKTLPTVDNLLRLKEIFSFSIDDILSESEPTEEKANEPKEAYLFKYEKSDLQEVFKKARLPLIKRAVIFVLACIVLFILFAATDAPDVMLGFLLGYFLFGAISLVKGYFAYKKVWKSSENRILESAYSYEIFDGYFVLNISRNDEITRTLKIYFEDIEKIQSFEHYLIMQVSGHSYIIKKDALISDSAFITFCEEFPDKVEVKKPKDSLKIISILLFVLSICTIWGALLGVAVLSEVNQAMTENMWVFFLFLPIPLASVVFGFYLKKKGYKYKKNVIVGFIMAALLCIYGSFSFIFADIYSHSDEPILNAEQTLNIDVPAHSRINTQDWTRGTQTVSREGVYSTGDIYFEDINILYNVESNIMKLVEYQIEYTKEC